jgi:hypothetical protein
MTWSLSFQSISLTGHQSLKQLDNCDEVMRNDWLENQTKLTNWLIIVTKSNSCQKADWNVSKILQTCEMTMKTSSSRIDCWVSFENNLFLFIFWLRCCLFVYLNETSFDFTLWLRRLNENFCFRLVLRFKNNVFSCKSMMRRSKHFLFLFLFFPNVGLSGQNTQIGAVARVNIPPIRSVIHELECLKGSSDMWDEDGQQNDWVHYGSIIRHYQSGISPEKQSRWEDGKIALILKNVIVCL